MSKPGRGGKNKIVVVPSTVEEKFVHDTRPQPQEEQESSSGGSGDGEEGEVIGEESAHEAEGESGAGAGQGEPGEHEIESSAYDLGKILTEKFQLPNSRKREKAGTVKYTYDLTDRAHGAGQIIDKKATLKKILETNINLERVSAEKPIDPTELLISPGDRCLQDIIKGKGLRITGNGFSSQRLLRLHGRRPYGNDRESACPYLQLADLPV